MTKIAMLGLGAALGLMFATTNAALAAPACGPYGDVTSALTDTYGEESIFSGASAEGGVELFADRADGSWSVVTVAPGGMTCLRAAGKGFELLGEPVEDTVVDPVPGIDANAAPNPAGDAAVEAVRRLLGAAGA